MKKIREGYKITEIGEIPSEWEVKKLSDIAEINPKKAVIDDNDKVSFIAMEDVSNSGRVMNLTERLYGEVKKGYTPFKNNDVLLAKITPCFENGKRAIVENLLNGIGFGSTEFHVLRETKESIAKYLYYVIISHRFTSKAENNMTGSAGQKRVPTEFIKDYILCVPTLNEQEKIASILSTVDEQIDNVDELIKKNKELKKGLMQKLLTKGIGHTKFKKTEIGEIPEEWEVKKFFDFVEKIIDFRGRTPKKLGMDWGDGDIQALSANNVKMGKIDFSLECYLASLELYEKWMQGNELEKDDILMTMEAPLGNIALVPDERKYILSQRVIALKSKDNIVNKFMKYLLMSDIVQSQLDTLSTGTTAKGINQKNLAKVIVLIPSIEEQEKIASILSEVDKKIEEYENKKQKLEELKKGLMQQLLTGKIRVSK